MRDILYFCIVLYHTQADHYRQLFGSRVQKLSVDAGFTCPNRDGRVGTGGCTFCLNEAFNPSYCRRTGSITTQLDEGIAFHRHRYRTAPRYLAYFQAYSNTYAPIDMLEKRYAEALEHPEVIGLVVGTRPDCVDDDNLHLLSSFKDKGYYVAIEMGVESCYDSTLEIIHRGHTFACAEHAIRLAASHGLPVGVHLILGLPGESRRMMIDQTAFLNALPINSLKLHQLQILNGTPLEQQCRNEDFRKLLWQPTLGEYISLVCDILERLRPDLVIERLAGEVPPRYQACPERSFRRADGGWLRNEQIPALVEAELARRGTRQGALYQPNQNQHQTQ